MKAPLYRFIKAQGENFDSVLSEMKNGKKEGHWMWYFFPQINGLGTSAIAKEFALNDIQEAEDYLLNETLSKRLLMLTSVLVYEVHDTPIETIFDFPYHLKFHSCMTLFYMVVISNTSLKKHHVYECFKEALIKYFNGKGCKKTIELVEKKVMFVDQTPDKFKEFPLGQDENNYKIQYTDLSPMNNNGPLVGNLVIFDKAGNRLTVIEQAMGPARWNKTLDILVLPVLKIHWLKGICQKFVMIKFEERKITFFKDKFNTSPIFLTKVECNNFYFKFMNKGEVTESFFNSSKGEVEKVKRF